jgi:nickel/cobalt transporter (NicO) family protein
MSVTAQTLSPGVAVRSPLLLRLALAVGAIVLVASGVALLIWLLAPASPPPPVRNPFGIGVREAAPSASGIGGYILAVQGQFYRSLQAAVAALKENGGAIWSLMAIGFAYGVFHAAGPGHGKAVIAAYLVSSERALVRGFGLSLAAALVQAVVAVTLVGVVAIVLRATAATMSQVTNVVEITSFVAVAALGAALVWRKAGKVLGLAAAGEAAHHHAGHHHHGHAHHEHSHSCGDCCGHLHVPPPEVVEGRARWRDMTGVVLAAGLRPCAGAIVVLVFALSQGLFPAGIAAAFAMALGTALTTGLFATLAVFAKAVAVRLAHGRGTHAPLAIAGVELLAAAFVLVLGVSLLAGVWTNGAAS